MKTLTFITLLLAFTITASAQAPVSRIIDTEGFTNDTVVVPVVAYNFYKINLNAMVIRFDTASLQLVDVTSDYVSIASQNVGALVVYSTSEVTISDGDTLLYVNFKFKGVNTIVRFDTAQGLCEYADSLSNIISMPVVADYFRSGAVTLANSLSPVHIGSQYWLPDNLAVGDAIKSYQESTDNNRIEKYCYNNLEFFCAIYGGLYKWDEVMQYVTTTGSQGICPHGYHIPTKVEFDTLMNRLGSTRQGDGFAGLALKSDARWDSLAGITTGINSSGFNALPAGYNQRTFHDIGKAVHFWTSTEVDGSVWVYSLNYYDYSYKAALRPKDGAYSLRCIKNQ